MWPRVVEYALCLFQFQVDVVMTVVLCLVAGVFWLGYSEMTRSRRGKRLCRLASWGIVFCLVLSTGCYLLRRPRGLPGRYYTDAAWTKLPDRSMTYFDMGGQRTDRTLDFETGDIVTHYPFPGKPFSVEWHGYIYLPDGSYTPEVNTNFHSWLTVDDVLIAGNSKLDFGSPEARQLLREGWSHDEQWGGDGQTTFIWSQGHRTEFYLGLAGLADYSLVVRCMPFSYKGSPQQELNISINNMSLGRIVLEDGWKTYQIQIPRTLLQDVVPGFFRVKFTYSHVTRPSELNAQSPDQRQLAVAFDFAMLQKTAKLSSSPSFSPSLSPSLHHIALKTQSDGNDPFLQLVWKREGTDKEIIISEDYLFPEHLSFETLQRQLPGEQLIFRLLFAVKIILIIILSYLLAKYIDVISVGERVFMWFKSWKIRAFLKTSSTGGVGLVSLLLAWRLFHLIDLHAVNILYWDQWDFYGAFFDHKSLWELFRLQHGPHRQGLGFLFSKLIAELSGWNTRTEVFAIGGVICGAMLCALWLKVRLFKFLSWTDIAIPLIFLTPIQYGIFFNTPNLSHGAFPLLLLVLYALAWTIPRCPLQYSAVLLLNFFLIYTGFGVFTGMITPILFALEAFHAYRHRQTRAAIGAFFGLGVFFLSAASFFYGYTFQATVPGFQFPYPQYWQYPQFIALAFAHICGVEGIGIFSQFVGFCLFFLVLLVWWHHAKRLYHDRFELLHDLRDRNFFPKYISRSIFTFTSFSLIFACNIAIGRISLGLHAAQASRYVPYLIPALFGTYLHLTTLVPGKRRVIVQAIAVVGLFAASFPLRAGDAQGMKWFSEGKTLWKDAYLRVEDIQEADRLSQFSAYPWPEATHLKEKLHYLKIHHLNLYRETPKQKSPPEPVH